MLKFMKSWTTNNTILNTSSVMHLIKLTAASAAVLICCSSTAAPIPLSIEAPATITAKELTPTCSNCTAAEQTVLTFLHENEIKDKAAQAVILGAIKQESRFNSNICEGGRRTAYSQCGRGYGLIQWTYPSRYYGLGSYARQIGQRPEALDTQLRYMLTEVEWRRVAPTFTTAGLPMNTYINAEHRWIGSGIRGNRTQYAYDYLGRIT
jgi:hypothetical protein